MYYLFIRWSYDDEDVEAFATKEERQARIDYLKTLPKVQGVQWRIED